ncbi:MAG: response regulator [Hungatella sp.]
MYRAIIADDEIKSRKLLLKLANWDAHNITVAAQCEDGDELYAAAKQWNPDIVITDMRMPGLCGSDLIRELRILNQDCKIIVISGFDEYEYIRQALSSKAVDYLLKPLSEKELNLALSKACEELASEALRQNRIEKSVMVQKLKNCIYENVPVERDLAIYLEAQSKGKGYWGIHILCMQKEPETVSFHYSELLEYISQSLESFGILMEFGKNRHEFAAVLFGMDLHAVESWANDVTNHVSQLTGFCTIIGIGHNCSDITGIHNSYEEAAIAVINSPADSKSKVLSFDRQNSLNRAIEADVTQEEYLLKNIAGLGNTTALLQQIKLFYHRISSAETLNIAALRKYNAVMIGSIERLLRVCQTEESVLVALAALEHQISITLNLGGILQMTETFFEALPKECYAPKHKSKILASQIRSYLNDNFQEKITLSSLAEHFFVNKEYLSRLFRQEFSVSVFDYLDLLRVEAAKRLLQEGESVSNAAITVGFYDESHFNKKFKRIVGISPKEFKTR